MHSTFKRKFDILITTTISDIDEFFLGYDSTGMIHPDYSDSTFGAVVS